MKTLIGQVVSTKMTNTVIVEIQRQRLHPLYKKFIRRSKRYKAGNTDPSIQEGDIVKIVSNKPISKEKHYKVVGKVKKA